MLRSGFKESILTINPLKGFLGKRKRVDVEDEFHIRAPIYIQGWDSKTWETYIYYLNTGGYSYLSDDRRCDLLDLFKLADMVGDGDLLSRLTAWFERSTDQENIIPRVFSGRYHGFGLERLEDIFEKIFLKFWMDKNVKVRERTLEFLDQLESEENGSNQWTGKKARKLHSVLTAKLPFRR